MSSPLHQTTVCTYIYLCKISETWRSMITLIVDSWNLPAPRGGPRSWASWSTAQGLGWKAQWDICIFIRNKSILPPFNHVNFMLGQNSHGAARALAHFWVRPCLPLHDIPLERRIFFFQKCYFGGMEQNPMRRFYKIPAFQRKCSVHSCHTNRFFNSCHTKIFSCYGALISIFYTTTSFPYKNMYHSFILL